MFQKFQAFSKGEADLNFLVSVNSEVQEANWYFQEALDIYHQPVAIKSEKLPINKASKKNIQTIRSKLKDAKQVKKSRSKSVASKRSHSAMSKKHTPAKVKNVSPRPSNLNLKKEARSKSMVKLSGQTSLVKNLIENPVQKLKRKNTTNSALANKEEIPIQKKKKNTKKKKQKDLKRSPSHVKLPSIENHSLTLPSMATKEEPSMEVVNLPMDFDTFKKPNEQSPGQEESQRIEVLSKQEDMEIPPEPKIGQRVYQSFLQFNVRSFMEENSCRSRSLHQVEMMLEFLDEKKQNCLRIWQKLEEGIQIPSGEAIEAKKFSFEPSTLQLIEEIQSRREEFFLFLKAPDSQEISELLDMLYLLVAQEQESSTEE